MTAFINSSPTPYPYKNNGTAILNGTRTGGISSSASKTLTGSISKTHLGSWAPSCYAISFSMTQSIETRSAASYTDFVLDNETTSGSVHLYNTAPFTQSLYENFNPPRDCCAGCEVNADRVRVLFWPVDDNTLTTQNVSIATAASPYTTVSDGFTL